MKNSKQFPSKTTQPANRSLESASAQNPIQAMADQSPQVQRQAALQRKESTQNHSGLPAQLKGGIESLSGMDMSGVKVHYNSSQPAQLNAHAYAQGNDIHVAPGQEQHLPHEAWHIVQQQQGRVKPSVQMKGINVNDDKGLEKEADVMGAKAVSQLKAKGHDNGCSCSSCGGGRSEKSAASAAPAQLQAVAQLTCDAGHKQHKNGPCPDTAAGKVARMAGTHHQKTGRKGTPKKRLEKWAEQNQKDAEDRMNQ